MLEAIGYLCTINEEPAATTKRPGGVGTGIAVAQDDGDGKQAKRSPRERS